MKASVVLAVSIVLVSIFFCPMVIAAPTMPADLQMVQPDPSLPKELSAFFGKWEFRYDLVYFVPGQGASHVKGLLVAVVEKINEEKASLYIFRSGSVPEGTPLGWVRYEAKVIKNSGKYKISYHEPFGAVEWTLQGDNIVMSAPNLLSETSILKRLP